jgi:hypothetical protein
MLDDTVNVTTSDTEVGSKSTENIAAVVAGDLVRDPEVRKHAPGSDEYNAAVAKLTEKKTLEAAPGASEDLNAQTKKKSGLERRFSELTGERDQYKNRAAELEARLAQIEAERTAKAKDAVVDVESTSSAESTRDQFTAPDTEFTKPKPSIDNFDTMADYQEALVDWKLEKKEFEAEMKVKAREYKHAQEAVVSTWDAREKDAKLRNEGYDVLVTTEFAEKFAKNDASREAMQYLLDSDFGPDLLYHLANDDDDRAAFKKMTPVKQVAYLAKLDSKMEPVKQSDTKPTTKAPAPSKPLPKGKTVTPVKDITNGIDNFKDYLAWRNQQKKK